MNATELVCHLIGRGDHIALIGGRLELRAASGNPIPDGWMKQNSSEISYVILRATNQPAFEHLSFSAGKFGKHLAGGVELQFRELISDRNGYVIFPAEVVRATTTIFGKAGAALPKNHFRTKKNTKFYKFWRRTGLKIPNRLSSFHDYMGNLQSLLFTADFVNGEKLNKDTIEPLNISFVQIKSAFQQKLFMDKPRTAYGQAADNKQTIFTDNEIAQSHEWRGFYSDLNKGVNKHGKRLTGNEVIGSHLLSVSSPILRPEEQNHDEWLADYSS
jgi:hypothetical protein